ncbi:MAG: hypothetical protein AAGE52_35210 [Myxococcota bacterium]
MTPALKKLARMAKSRDESTSVELWFTIETVHFVAKKLVWASANLPNHKALAEFLREHADTLAVAVVDYAEGKL